MEKNMPKAKEQIIQISTTGTDEIDIVYALTNRGRLFYKTMSTGEWKEIRQPNFNGEKQ
jgi:hypothetical protein